MWAVRKAMLAAVMRHYFWYASENERVRCTQTRFVLFLCKDLLGHFNWQGIPWEHFAARAETVALGGLEDHDAHGCVEGTLR